MIKEDSEELSFKELVEKINDYYHNGTVLIFSDFVCGKINIANTNNMLAEESDERITIIDDTDLEIVMFKSHISNITLSDFELDNEEIIIDLGDSNISFVLCNC
jgi:hypothetical protein